MMALKTAAQRVAVLLVFQALWPGIALSQGTGSPAPSVNPKISEEISKQESIYQGKGEQLDTGYVIDRSLLSYTFTLPAEFDRSLANLGPGDRWLDIGAGEGQAVLDYYTPRYDSMHAEGRERRGSKARAVAISIEDRRTPRWHQMAASLEANKIRYLFSKRLREYSLEELGRFQLITDVIGGFSYSVDLSLFMEKTLGFLELNGSFYSLLQDIRSESETNSPHYPGSPFLTELKNADGSELKVCSWLKSISCVEVTCQFRPEWRPAIEVYRVQKVCNNVTVPALGLTHYTAGTPPERAYRLRNPSPASPDPAGAAR